MISGFPGRHPGREHHLHIILTFRETEPGRHRVRRFRPLQRCWVPCDDGYHRVFYRPEGELAEDDSVMTLRSFIDGEGEALVLEEIDELARHGAFDAGAAPARCALYAPHP